MKKGGPKHILNKFQSQNNNMGYKNNNAMQTFTQNYKLGEMAKFGLGPDAPQQLVYPAHSL